VLGHILAFGCYQVTVLSVGQPQASATVDKVEQCPTS
jgi:hypothetical protein